MPKTTLAIDIANNFEPKYVNMSDKKDVIKTLKEKSSFADAEILRLFNLIAPERGHVIDVSADKILSIIPEMTFDELIAGFGETTMIVSTGMNEHAVLYKYRDIPFYIRYKRRADLVNYSGQELFANILIDFNLGEASNPSPEPLKNGRLELYKAAFDKMIGVCLPQPDFIPRRIVIDTHILPHIDNEERNELIQYLANMHHTHVEDKRDAALYKSDDWKHDIPQDCLALWIKEYTFIGAERMDFTAAGRMCGGEIVTVNMSFVFEDESWEERS